MAFRKTIYHFLDPEFGYPFIEYFDQMKVREAIQIVLVFSSKNFTPNRKSWNPLKILDWFSTQNIKAGIIKKYKPFGFQIKFVEDVNDLLFVNGVLENACGICTGFNQIFKEELISKLVEFVNIHPSLLPLYRGPTPVEWCVENKEEYTGWTLHKITEKVDAGEILFQEIIKIDSKPVHQIKSEIVDHAKIVLYNYIISKNRNAKFVKKQLNPEKYYLKKVGYKTFFK